MSGLIGPLFQLKNYAVGFQGHQGVELIFCYLNAMGGTIGVEMKLLLDFSLRVEEQQPDGSLQPLGSIRSLCLKRCAGGGGGAHRCRAAAR